MRDDFTASLRSACSLRSGDFINNLEHRFHTVLFYDL
ncbi:gluconate 5-dehydrogenase [Yersinia sp. Marseille-Q3913]|nr:gluconate 5-dehydrogenase [Yersinia sp. Marseille-Q3913]